ncbi:MAG: DNA repair protein RecN [Gammaproteobacteria bacterium]|nr:DNA repair protein RecN [Gammaproteobacteria bacterium]
MLSELQISNFAIVDQAALELSSGMTTITGETGAGKSIAIDALGLCLGERADAALVRHGAERCEVTAVFRIGQLAEARQWLQEQALDSDDDCIIRRVVSSEGRSKGYVNGQPVTAAQLKALGELLVSIHGQHAHQALLRPDVQRQLLDRYGDLDRQLEQLRLDWRQWQELKRRLEALRSGDGQREARRQLLHYQVEELEQFALQPGEFDELEAEQRRLAHAQQLLASSSKALALLSDSDGLSLIDALEQCNHELSQQLGHDQQLGPIVELLDEAQIRLDEAVRSLRRYSERVELDPERLAQLDERIAQALQLARKHKVTPAELPEVHQTLAAELSNLAQSDSDSEQLAEQLAAAASGYQQQAEALHQARQAAGERLAAAVTAAIASMNMPHARLVVAVTARPEQPGPHGWDQIELLVSANPGQPPQPLAKVASGGELSRIGLAIAVLTADANATPTLIFDEVDVGISGATAAVVGRLLRQLGERAQVMCVTHLPQVAAAGHQQLLVSKQSDGVRTHTRIDELDEAARTDEVARMVAGDALTSEARANARALLSQFVTASA